MPRSFYCALPNQNTATCFLFCIAQSNTATFFYCAFCCTGKKKLKSNVFYNSSPYGARVIRRKPDTFNFTSIKCVYVQLSYCSISSLFKHGEKICVHQSKPFSISHNTPLSTTKFFCHFSWNMKMSHEKFKKMSMQILGGKKRCIMGFV